MKKRTISCRMLALLFCISILSIGMYTPNTGVDSRFSYSDSSHSMSTTFSSIQKTDALNAIGDITDEIVSSISSRARTTFSYRLLPLITSFSTALQPFIPPLIGIVFIVLLQNEFVDRMYLILFIHNSDGKKET